MKPFTVDANLINAKLTGYLWPNLNSEKKYNFSGAFTLNTGAKVYIKEVIYNDPATIVLWSDGTKTVSKAVEGDCFNMESGLTICILKKIMGRNDLKMLLKNWIPEQVSINPQRVTLKEVMKNSKK